MSIRKWKGSWQVRVFGFPNVSLPPKAAAERKELDLTLRKKLGRLYLERPTSFGEELDAHLERKRSMGGRNGALRSTTVAYYEQCSVAWQSLRDIPVSSLSRSIVEDHVQARSVVAPVAARNELQFAKAMQRTAESRGQQVDAAIFAIGPVHHEAAEGRALELDELDSIASWMPERIKRIVPFCGLVGLRWSEAANLSDSMVDLDQAQLLVPREINKARRPKPIPLANVEVQLLREQRMVRPPGTSILFPNGRGGVYTKSGFRSVWLPALLAAGFAHGVPSGEKVRVVADFKFHWLRHTAISLMARAGMAPELIALRVGHRDGGSLIYRRYRHLYDSELRAAVGLIEGFVSSASPRSSAAPIMSAE